MEIDEVAPLASGAPLERLKAGDAVPDLALADSSGGSFSVADHRGQWLVLYFYPRDNTSGCTREAEDFTRLLGDFDLLGARVVGSAPIRSRATGVSSGAGTSR
ncbi:peroxiredoxin [Candidatus Fermentibacterales bacterium]|nr:peroxiredoxin [Candidatus Fermentibacterales bacterium]